MQTPSVYQQPGNPVAPYYPPPAARPRDNPRMLALGILNVVFGYVYLVLTISILVGAAGLKMQIGDLLQVVGLGWAGIGLMWGGILLLRGSLSGVGILKSVFWVVVGTLIVSMCTIFGQVSSRYHGAVIVTYLTQIFLFAFYPLIVHVVAGKIEDY